MSWQQKLTKRRLLGHTFVKKKTKLDGFWDPWGGHWEGLGWNFGPQKGKQKKHEKKRNRLAFPSRFVSVPYYQ